MMETNVFLGTFNATDIVSYPSPDLCLEQSCLGTLRTIPLTSWLGFCSDLHLSTVGPYRQVCAFPNHVQAIEFITGGLQSSCRYISRMINGNRMHLISISSLIAKGLNTYVKKVVLFLFFYTFANISKNLFLLCHYGVLCVD